VTLASPANASLDGARREVERLTAAGVLGFFTHFETTEIFAVRKGRSEPLNVFSLLVAEEHVREPARAPTYLGKPLQLRSLDSWSFGIKRSYLTLSDLALAFDRYQDTGKWQVSGVPIEVGPLLPVRTQFVPSDSTTLAPWNHVLKNNFWNGSYVVECADPVKDTLTPFFEQPPRLQELSEGIRQRIPISLASLSDRLGNVAVQIPSTVAVAKFSAHRLSGDAIVEVGWHPKATPRPLRVSCEMQHDKIYTGYRSQAINQADTVVPMARGDGMYRSVLWDDANGLIVAAAGETAFLTKIGLNIRAIDPEPRVFVLRDSQGNETAARVRLTNTRTTIVGPQTDERIETWTRKRIYRDEVARLAEQRRFVQYKPESGTSGQHAKAMDDLRLLINLYGEKAAWIWDPYLTAGDVLRTLFYCSHANSELRALSAARPIPDNTTQDAPSSKSTFAELQRSVFGSAGSRFRGLRLEFRVRTGQAGWPFHDRFLIFPDTQEGALAWSLGASVNSMGRQHHILQRVDNGQMIVDAFNELWDALSGPDHLVWKAP
jgi:hypothetical protein